MKEAIEQFLASPEFIGNMQALAILCIGTGIYTLVEQALMPRKYDSMERRERATRRHGRKAGYTIRPTDTL